MDCTPADQNSEATCQCSLLRASAIVLRMERREPAGAMSGVRQMRNDAETIRCRGEGRSLVMPKRRRGVSSCLLCLYQVWVRGD